MPAAVNPDVLNLDALSEQDFAAVVAELQRLHTERAQLVEALRNEMLALVRMQAQGSRSLLDWQDGTRYSADRLRALLRSLGETTC